MSPWFGIFVVLALLGAAFVVLRLLQVWCAPHPEILRKLMHVMMGLVTVSFPWLFEQIWPVLVLAGGSLVALVLVRRRTSVAASMHGVLHGIERESWGELLFPVAVAIVFVLADGDPLLYCVPILILTLADAVAALIGVYYGQLEFTTLEGKKSIEGSLGFFIVTFLCVHVAVLLFSDTGRAESLLIGLLMGVIVMMFEAVAWRGLDNLFIPLASFALLQSYLDTELIALVIRFGVLLLLGLFLICWRGRSTFDGSATMGAALVAYGAWAIGGIYWLLVPTSVFIISTLLTQRQSGSSLGQIHTVYALMGLSAPGLMWLLLGSRFDATALFFAYTVTFVAQHTMLAVSRAHVDLTRLPWRRMPAAIGQGLVLLLLPFALMWGWDPRLIEVTLIGGCAVTGAAFAFLYLQPSLEDCPATAERWVRQGLIAGVFSMLSWLLFVQDYFNGEAL